MKRLIVLALLAVSASLSGEPGRSPVLVAAPPPGSPSLTRPSEPGTAPFSVSARPDASRATTRRIPPEGGTLSAMAADGTVFTLTLPEGALMSEQDVKMTPISTIERLPLSGGLSAAVQLEPEGLLLFQPATLVIDSPIPIAAAQEMTFAWRGTGEEFFLYPPDPVGTSAISLTLSHFSGYGGGRGTSADASALAARPPVRAEDRLAHNLFGPVSAQRRARRGGKTPEQALIDSAVSVLSEYFLKVLGPLQPTTCRDDWRDFLSRLHAFERSVVDFTASQATLLKATHDYYKSFFDLIVGCYDQDYAHCKSDTDPRQGVEMYRIYRVLAREGLEVVVDRGKIARCLTFRLEFESFIQEQQFTGLTFAFRHQVSASVPDVVLSPFSEDPPHTVSGELRYDVAGYTGGIDPGTKCTLGTTGAPSVFDVVHLTGNFNAFESGATPPDWLEMEYDAGHPVFTATLMCSGAPVQLLSEPRWREIYEVRREDFAGTFHAKGWEKRLSPIFAIRKYEPPSDTLASDELTVLTLVHTPK